MSYYIKGMANNNEIRFFGVDSKDVVQRAFEIHRTTPVISAAMGRMLSAGSMLGSMLKNEQDLLTAQIKCEGPARGIIVTSDYKGNVKCFPYESKVDLPLKENGKLNVSGAIGAGMLTIIKDMGLKAPYVGKTHLVSSEIAEDFAYYFMKSEQVPSVVSLGVLVDTDYSIKCAGGFIIQLLPFASEDTIDLLEQRVGEFGGITSKLNNGETIEGILENLLSGWDFKITEKSEINYTCNCSHEKMEKALISIGIKDLTEIYKEDKKASLTCHFCGTEYAFNEEMLERLLEELH